MCRVTVLYGHPKNPAEFDRYSEAAGKGSHDAVTALVSSPGWNAMSAEGQRKAIKTAIDKARDVARGLPTAKVANISNRGSLPPPPPGFAVEERLQPPGRQQERSYSALIEAALAALAYFS